MVTEIFVGKPPASIEQWIKDQIFKDSLCFTAVDAGATITFKKQGSPDEASIVTSRDKYTWEPYTFNTKIILTNVGDKVYFRAADENDILFWKDNNNYYRFATTSGKKIAASGNIQTLLKANGSRIDVPFYCYAKMFQGCTSLTSAPELPATTLATNCYDSMFFGCTSLTSAPALPATILANTCYYYMFYGCSSLRTAPVLPATTLTLGCYCYMFSGCKSLISAPKLPATTLAYDCYTYMFSNCSSLTTAPELPATILDHNCYESMFSGCTSLSAAPALPATTLAVGCYYEMFCNCSQLTSINVSFSAWDPTNATHNWLVGVTATGTFTCPSTLSDTRGTSNIPEGWTKVDK